MIILTSCLDLLYFDAFPEIHRSYFLPNEASKEMLRATLIVGGGVLQGW